MLRRTVLSLKSNQNKYDTNGKGPKGEGRKSGGPGRRRLISGVTKTCPMLAYKVRHMPMGQPVQKKGVVDTLPKRRLPERQEYSSLTYETHDDTPQLLHANSLDLEGYGKKGGDYYDGYHFSNNEFRPDYQQRSVSVVSYNARDMGKVVYPPVPKVDQRTLSNKAYLEDDSQNRVRQYLQKHHIFSVFPRVSCTLNLSVSYGKDDSKRSYWDSVYRGNVIEMAKTVAQPKVRIPSDLVEEGALYTMLMLCPDHPFRADAEHGHVLHWAVSNITAEGGSVDVVEKADVVVPYLHPLPSEDAGLLRYIFVLFKQDARVETATLSETDAGLNARRHFFLHDSARGEGKLAAAMNAVEQQVDDEPEALSFFHTAFDYQVMEYYQKHDLPEPMYHPKDIVDDTVNFAVQDSSQDMAKNTPMGGIEHIHAGNKWGNRTQYDFF